MKNINEVRKYAKLNPTFIAIEPPELIGTGRAISTERPSLITNAVEAVKCAKNSTKLLCGAGIVSGQDVSKARGTWFKRNSRCKWNYKSKKTGKKLSPNFVRV